jgi:peptidoglycan/LPS O-acetylase OafA/YrhL
MGWSGTVFRHFFVSFLLPFQAENVKTGMIQVRKFYIRRLLRTYPLMIAFPATMLFFQWDRIDLQSLGRLLGIALFADNLISWFKSYNKAVPFSDHLWTLSFEFQVYLVIPFAFLALVRVGIAKFIRVTFAVLAFSLLLRIDFGLLGAPHPIG